MSKPQLENGYTRIANELLDALMSFRIPGEQMQCFLVIIRKTYGHRKPDDKISNSQLCEATGMLKGNVSRAIKELSKKQLVIKNDNTSPPTYRINKDYSQWVQLSKKQPVIKKATKVIKNDNNCYQKRGTQKKKETIQKKKTYAPFQALKYLVEKGVPKKTAQDWLVVRKTKRLANTETAFEAVIREAEKANLSFPEVIKICGEESWGGFKASWERKNTSVDGAPLPAGLTCSDCKHFLRCKKRTSTQKICRVAHEGKSYFEKVTK